MIMLKYVTIDFRVIKKIQIIWRVLCILQKFQLQEVDTTQGGIHSWTFGRHLSHFVVLVLRIQFLSLRVSNEGNRLWVYINEKDTNNLHGKHA